jgi:hypothetical protein
VWPFRRALFPEARRRVSAPALLAAAQAGVLLVGAVGVLDLRSGAVETPGVSVPVAQVARSAALPVELHIPALEVRSSLQGLRKDRAGVLSVPEDPQRAGWYSQGPAPGEAGPAVLVGHVDSYEGPGVFAGLADLQPGDVVEVRRSDGSVVAFAVEEVATFPKEAFPTERVYGGDAGRSLRLVTCGGSFDRDARSYVDNVVVFAAPVVG